MINFYILLSINLIISTFYTLFINNSDNFGFINSSFIVGMLYLLSGILSFVYEKGFFNITMYSFSKVGEYFQKKKGLIVEESSLEDYISRDNTFFLTNSLLWCGSFISIICIIISFLII